MMIKGTSVNQISFEKKRVLLYVKLHADFNTVIVGDLNIPFHQYIDHLD